MKMGQIVFFRKIAFTFFDNFHYFKKVVDRSSTWRYAWAYLSIVHVFLENQKFTCKPSKNSGIHSNSNQNFKWFSCLRTIRNYDSKERRNFCSNCNGYSNFVGTCIWDFGLFKKKSKTIKNPKQLKTVYKV